MQQYDFRPRTEKSRFLFWTITIVCIFGITFLASIAIAYKFYATSQKVIDNNQNVSFIESLKDIVSSNQKILRGEENGRINILLVGLAGKNYPGSNLTDSIIVASVNPKTYQTALLSIPRDFYVQIPDTNSYTKINALYARAEDQNSSAKSGIEDLKYAINDITGQPIDYYIALDFDGFRQIVDELSGINIQVPKDIHDERYPGPNYSYQTFDIQNGLQNLDGETALKYARTRHDEDGDFGRAYRQQLILESARRKAFSIGTLIDAPAINNILNILGDHLRTDIQLDEINSFLDLLNKIDTHTTINKVLDAGKANSVMAVSHVFLGGVRAFILIPRTGDYEEIQEIAKNIFDLDIIARKQAEIEKEEAIIAIVNQSGVTGFDGKLKRLLDKFGYKTTVGDTYMRLEKSRAYATTTIYDLTNGLKPFSLEDISKKLGAKISIYMPNNLSSECRDTDFCLVAGKDITDKLNYEESSVEDLESGYDRQQVDEKEFFELLKKGNDKKF